MPILLVLASFAFSALAAEHRFTFRLPAEPATLDWNKAHTPIETHMLVNLMEGLVSVDDQLRVQPALAEKWKISPDGLTYTFEIRKGAKWSDGVAVRAQDFVFSWKRLLTRATGAQYAYFLFDIEGAEAFFKGEQPDFSKVGVRAASDHQLVVKLARAVPYWIFLPSFWVTFPMREDLAGKPGWLDAAKLVSAGPYVLASRELDQRLTLKPNPHYWGKRGNLTEIVAQVVRDDSTALTLYESGKLDFLTDLSAPDVERLEKRPDLRNFPYLKTVFLVMVASRQPTDKALVRQAIAHAIDRGPIPKILHGAQKVAGYLVPPPILSADPKLGIAFDPKKARELLTKAGATSLPHADILIPNTEKATTVAQYLQGELKKNLGWAVGVSPFDNKTYRSQMEAKAFALYIGSWSADYPDPDNYASIFLSDAGTNRSGWKNGEYDKLVMSARTQKPSERAKTYRQAMSLLQSQEAIVLPLYYEPNLALVRTTVRGLSLNPLNYLYLRQVSLEAR